MKYARMALIGAYRKIPARWRRTCPHKPSCSEQGARMARLGYTLPVIAAMVCAECFDDN